MQPELLNLLHLCDPALPIGAFSHSAGLETFVLRGDVHDRNSAETFIRLQLEQNLRYTEGALVSLAHDAAVAVDTGRLIYLNGLAGAARLPSEILAASRKLGARLLHLFRPLVRSELLAVFHDVLDGDPPHYPVAFGTVAVALGISKEDALTGFLYNAVAGMVTNAVKLVPLGQQAGQELLFSIKPALLETAAQCIDPDPALIGLCAPGLDIRCMQHEQLYSRQYMS